MVHYLNAPLINFLAIENTNKGGSPGKLYRNYLIEQLTLVYEQIYGERATQTWTGGFVGFCDLVINAVAINTKGLEQALVRRLKRPQKR